MNKICIATHGELASGYKSALTMLTGLQDRVSYINAYVDESDYTQQLEEFYASLSDTDLGIVCTDLFGGSVFQRVICTLPSCERLIHITGINLALVIELLLSDDLTSEQLQIIVTQARETMQVVELPASEPAFVDEDFFD